MRFAIFSAIVAIVSAAPTNVPVNGDVRTTDIADDITTDAKGDVEPTVNPDVTRDADNTFDVSDLIHNDSVMRKIRRTLRRFGRRSALAELDKRAEEATRPSTDAYGNPLDKRFERADESDAINEMVLQKSHSILDQVYMVGAYKGIDT
ncbi:hypothetical protein VHEMI04667 [[Torrubiella] hemipterigena]|uniref:RxLR effector protein n=1 Tax=[Torrubiella] hemipterigena TaxID=1531966 RepID=A0A0A1SVX3_9HYPO|nr:hypothetical protein VHEMI04667 [[Torrubiella] hemipterigena]